MTLSTGFQPSLRGRRHSLLRLSSVAHRVEENIEQTVAVRRCAQYREAFRGAAVSFPVEVIAMDAPSAWVRRHGISVDVADIGGLEAAMAAGVDPLRVVMGFADSSAGPIRRAVGAGVGRVVINSAVQAAVLADAVTGRQRVLVEVTDQPVEALAAEVVGRDRLELIGLHRRLLAGEHAVSTVVTMIRAMRRVARESGVIPARLSLADIDVADWGCDPADLGAVSDAIDDAIETGCIAASSGRPAVNLAPSFAALVPTPKL